MSSSTAPVSFNTLTRCQRNRQQAIESVLQIDSSYGFGYCWDHFLDQIVNREAALERAAMEPSTLRSVMERLASIARSRPSGAGPITSSDLADAYSKETGQTAGEAVLAQLQRLPGLTQRDSDPGLRSFVDEDMLCALQGGAFAKSILGHFQINEMTSIGALQKKAVIMAAYVLENRQTSPQTVMSVIDRVHSNGKKTAHDAQFIADAFSVAIEMLQTEGIESVDFRGMTVDCSSVGKIDLEEIEIRNIIFRSCMIEEIVLGKGCENYGIRFSDCLISKLSGASDRSAIPESIFDSSCEIESFDDFATNNAVLKANIPPKLKALLTVLRKLYKQAGAGRKLSALTRGIGQQDVASCIDEVISTLQREGVITIFNKVIHPVRRHSARVEKILSAPTLSDDPIVASLLSKQ